MIKENIKEIVKMGIHPPLKNAGFKKSGNNFVKKLEEVQQVVTLQLSRGNSYNNLRFYFRCGFLIDSFKTENRVLKSEPSSDYRFSINQVSDIYDTDQFDLTIETDTKLISEEIKFVIENNLNPFFSKLESEETCLQYMVKQSSLQADLDIIKYLCARDRAEDLRNYMIHIVKFLKSIKDKYSDPNVARKRVDRYKSLIKEEGKLTVELKNDIEKSW